MAHLDNMREIINTTVRNRGGKYKFWTNSDFISDLAYNRYALWYRSLKSKDVSTKQVIDRAILYIKEAEIPFLVSE